VRRQAAGADPPRAAAASSVRGRAAGAMAVVRFRLAHLGEAGSLELC